MRKLRRLPWDEPGLLCTVIKVLSHPDNVKFSLIGALATITADLTTYQPVGVYVVDAVLEEIRVGLEINHPAQQQRRIAYMQYLGRLYLYRVCDSQVVFDTLYLLLTFGHAHVDGALSSVHISFIDI